MKEIKTKAEDVKPKLMEHAAKAPKTAAKDLWLKFKEKSISEIKETPFAGQRGESSNAPANNAGDQMLSGAETTAREGASLTYRGGKSWRRPQPGKSRRSRNFPARFPKRNIRPAKRWTPRKALPLKFGQSMRHSGPSRANRKRS